LNSETQHYFNQLIIVESKVEQLIIENAELKQRLNQLEKEVVTYEID